MSAHEVLKALWALLFNKKDTNMSINLTNKAMPKILTAPVSIPVDTSSVSAIVKSSVGLKFSNGYEFNISFENKKMIISATVNGKEAFYLDDIPEEFIEYLRGMLK